MAHKIVFVSYAIRGALHSQRRRADAAAARRLLEVLRKKHKDAIFVAPYLLYADCSDSVVAARIQLAGWDHNRPDELWLFGPALCDGMRSEVAHMRKLRLPILVMSPELDYELSRPPRMYRIAAE